MSAADRVKTNDVLAVCEYCDREGPASRLREHYEQDHPELFWPAPGMSLKPPEFIVSIPGRFRHRLERIKRQTGKSYGAIIAGALDAQGLGRCRKPGQGQ